MVKKKTQHIKGALCRDLLGYQAKRTFWFWIRNPKWKRSDMEEILDNLLFSYWLLVVRDDNFELELVSLMTIWCPIVVGNEKELKGDDWLRGFFWRSSEFLAPNKWWLSNRAFRYITPLKYQQQHRHDSTTTQCTRQVPKVDATKKSDQFVEVFLSIIIDRLKD